MSLNLDKTDLKDGALIITNDDGSIQCIPEDGATEEEKAWFEEFRQAFPDGKPEPISLEDAKVMKIQEMSNVCHDKIVNEFYSACLGNKDDEGNIIKDHFDCDDRDQIYIQGLANKATLIANGMTTDGVLEWKKAGELICYPWNPQQCIALGLDMFSHITDNKKRYEAIRQYIQYDESLTDTATVQAIKWDDTIPDKYFSVITQGSDTNATA